MAVFHTWLGYPLRVSPVWRILAEISASVASAPHDAAFPLLRARVICCAIFAGMSEPSSPQRAAGRGAAAAAAVAPATPSSASRAKARTASSELNKTRADIIAAFPRSKSLWVQKTRTVSSACRAVADSAGMEKLIETYNTEGYSCMNLDTKRNKVYQAAIESLVREGKLQWLEVGPGASALLTQMVLKAHDETHIVAVEGNSASADAAVRALKDRYGDRKSALQWEVHRGLVGTPAVASTLLDSGRTFQCVLQEILGFFASSEGVAYVIHQLQASYMRKMGVRAPPPVYVPSAAATFYYLSLVKPEHVSHNTDLYVADQFMLVSRLKAHKVAALPLVDPGWLDAAQGAGAGASSSGVGVRSGSGSGGVSVRSGSGSSGSGIGSSGDYSSSSSSSSSSGGSSSDGSSSSSGGSSGSSASTGAAACPLPDAPAPRRVTRRTASGSSAGAGPNGGGADGGMAWSASYADGGGAREPLPQCGCWEFLDFSAPGGMAEQMHQSRRAVFTVTAPTAINSVSTFIWAGFSGMPRDRRHPPAAAFPYGCVGAEDALPPSHTYPLSFSTCTQDASAAACAWRNAVVLLSRTVELLPGDAVEVRTKARLREHVPSYTMHVSVTRPAPTPAAGAAAGAASAAPVAAAGAAAAGAGAEAGVAAGAGGAGSCSASAASSGVVAAAASRAMAAGAGSPRRSASAASASLGGHGCGYSGAAPQQIFLERVDLHTVYPTFVLAQR